MMEPTDTVLAWVTPNGHDELAPALVGALGELEEIPRTRTAMVRTRDGGTYSYGYADLGDVLTAARKVLAHHDLASFQTAVVIGEEIAVTTTLLHKSGQYLVAPSLRLPAGTNVQGIGSAITYARRYALMAVLGLAGGDDDDGRAANAQPPAQPAWPKARMTKLRNTLRRVEPDDDARRGLVELIIGHAFGKLDELPAAELVELEHVAADLETGHAAIETGEEGQRIIVRHEDEPDAAG